jgi:HAD superfamily hydrolase (TIGR01484 family)
MLPHGLVLTTVVSMSRRYELLVVDLDGTLLDRKGQVSERNCRILAEARADGMEVVIATGRAWSESRKALEAVSHEGWVVAAGGSLLSDAATGRTVHRHVMPHDVVVELTDALVSHGHKALLLKDAHITGYDYVAVGPGELDPASRWWFEQFQVKVRHVDGHAEDEHPHDTVRAGAVACGTRLTPLAEWCRDALGDRCFSQHWSAVTESEAIGSTTHLLEVFHPRVNKWTMVEHVCKDMGISRQQVAAIGDGLNDLELIREAGLGIAMANAVSAVTAVADRVTEDFECDGVATAVERILSGEW